MNNQKHNLIPKRRPLTGFWLTVFAAVLCAAGLGAFLLNQKGNVPDVVDEPPPDASAKPAQASTIVSEIRRVQAQEKIALQAKESMKADNQAKDPSAVPFAALAPNDDPGFRMCAMTSGGRGSASVGIVDRQTGKVNLLKTGDKTANGWLLVSADFKNETARFEKDGTAYTAHLEQGTTAPPASEALAAHRPSKTEAASPSPLTKTEPKTAFSNRIYQVEGGESVAVNAIADSTEFVEVKTGGETYALRREIVDTIFKVDNLTTEEQLWMMVSYPGLAAVPPGQSASEQAAEAERKLNEMLVPPTMTPPTEELDRLRENFIPQPPSETGSKKRKH